MKKIYLVIVLLISLFITAQNNISTNPFTNNNKDLNNTYERKPNENRFNNEEVKTNDYEMMLNNYYSSQDNSSEYQDNKTNPGAPGEPIPVDSYLLALFIVAVGLCLVTYKKI